jgi:hypothetical protein
MITNPNLLIPVYRVESQGRTETFDDLDVATIFLRSEAKEGKSPLSLAISTIRHSDYVKEVESQENRLYGGQEVPSK